MNKIVTCLCFCLITFGPVGHVNATDWQLLKKLSDSNFFIDRDSIKGVGNVKNNGDRRKVQTLISYQAMQRNVSGASFMSMSFVDVVSCSNRTMATISSKQYAGENGTGKVVNFHNMNAIVPMEVEIGTVNEYVMDKLVCSH